MTIKIKDADGSSLKFWLPNSWIKSRILGKIIKKNYGEQSTAILNITPAIYKSLKKYIKENGHFVLVDITSSDGDKVYIKV